ncbi:hypothetical protein Avbf_06040 [Armadillidium vulgare]|nr:hypothetical protein Avbf_06040 [Armadillidium vulgare]
MEFLTKKQKITQIDIHDDCMKRLKNVKRKIDFNDLRHHEKKRKGRQTKYFKNKIIEGNIFDESLTDMMTDLTWKGNPRARKPASKLKRATRNDKKGGIEEVKETFLPTPIERTGNTRSTFIHLASGIVEIIEKCKASAQENDISKYISLSKENETKETATNDAPKRNNRSNNFENLNFANADCAFCKSTQKVTVLYHPEDLKNNNLKVSFEISNGYSVENIDVIKQIKDGGSKTVSDKSFPLTQKKIPSNSLFEGVKEPILHSDRAYPVSETTSNICTHCILNEDEEKNVHEKQNNRTLESPIKKKKELSSSKIRKMLRTLDNNVSVDNNNDCLSAKAKLINSKELVKLKKTENHANLEKPVELCVDPQVKEKTIFFHMPIDFKYSSDMLATAEVFYGNSPRFRISSPSKHMFRISTPLADLGGPSGSNEVGSGNEK